MSNQPSNFERSNRAAQILYAYDCFEAGDSETAVRDLLTDLMHYCNQNGIDFPSEYGAACGAYEAELSD